MCRDANVECAECHGLGTSYTADLEKRAEQTESAFAAERQERERLAGALRGLVGAASAVPLWLAYGALYGLVGWWDEMRDAWRRP